jgi:rhamnogalacturonan endolyase
VLGEYAKADVTVKASQAVDLGELKWVPVRYGRQLWEIGTPDRTAGEFLHGDEYWQWGLYNRYPQDFPNDVNYVVGKSDCRRDWNLMQVPRATDNSGKSRGSATTWSILFDMEKQVRGRATLRIAFAGTEARSLAVAVNDQLVETLAGFRNTSVIHRDANRSYWTERAVAFDAALLNPGRNAIKLTVPAGPVMSGMAYDYLRLELDEKL